MHESHLTKHNNCELSIRWKLFKNKTSPTAGLFCSCHDTFLDWLPDDIAYDLIDNHRILIEPYSDRKLKKKIKIKKKHKKKLTIK